MTRNDETQTEAPRDEAYEQRIDQASGQRVGPPDTGETDEEAVRAGDERWERTRASH